MKIDIRMLPKTPWLRRRIIAVYIVLAGAWVLSLVIAFWHFKIYDGESWAIFEHGAFDAWIGELLFFSIVGLLVAIITLRDPSTENFEERLRILYGNVIPDTVMAYNRNQIAKLAAFYRKGTRFVIIDDYDDKLKAYHLIFKTEYVIFNPLDVSYKNTTSIKITPDPFDDAASPPEIGRVLSIKFEKDEHVKDHILITKSGFSTDVHVTIEPRQTANYVYEYSMWILVDVPQVIRPLRVVEQFFLDIVSRCSHTLRVKAEGDGRVSSLLFNQPYQLGPVQGVSPGETAFSFTLLPPSEPVATDAVAEVRSTAG